MRPQGLHRPFAGGLPLLLLALAFPQGVSSQPLTVGPPGLAPEVRARLSQTAGDTLLSPWQREFMKRLARGGAAPASDPATAGTRAEPSLRASNADDGSWAEIVTGGRCGHTAIYDRARDRMVVFGGHDGTNARNDVWALSLAGTPTWTALTPSGTPPSARSSASAIYDPVRDRMVVFGGHDGTNARNDVWALSLAGTPAWTQLAPTGTPPSARRDHTAIYDPVRDRMIVFGGFDGSAYHNDVWALSLAGATAWAALAPSGTLPSARYFHSAIYDSVGDRMLMFGGYGGTDLHNDVWGLTLAGTPTWKSLTPTGTSTTARFYHTAIYDPVRRRMIVFGGIELYGYLNDVSALSLAGTRAWTELAPRPRAREYSSAIHDPVRDRMVVFGGDNYDILNDVWELPLAGTPAWTALAPTGAPPSGRRGHGAIYDPVRDRMVVFGGTDGTNARNDVWALSLSGTPVWTALTPAGTLPGGRSAHSAIYDPMGDRMVVFGGSDALLSYRSDVWALSLAGTVTDVQASLVSADAAPERVRLEWALGSGAGVSATVYRCTTSTPWQALGTVSADGTGRIRYEDGAVAPGARYGYRLGVRDGEREGFAGETWVEVPAAASFALSGARPNPTVGGGLWVRFALPTAEPASLELYDVSGRQVESRNAGALGAGEHELRLDSGAPMAPGVYLLRLTQGIRSLTARAVVIR